MLDSLRQLYGRLLTSGLQLLLLFIAYHQQSRLGWLVCLALIAAISLLAWRSAYRRRRAILDVPTSKIASAAQGYVELRGQGQPLHEMPIHAPFSGTPCLWYRHQVERNDDRPNQSLGWQIGDCEESEASFVLVDDSGRCVIDVSGAEVSSMHKQVERDGNCRHTEWLLLPGDPVYAIGDFRTRGANELELDRQREIRELLAEWKQDQPNLLARFDLNRDGELDLSEWGLARAAAQREVDKTHAELRQMADVHYLGRPHGGGPFLISNLAPEQLALRFLAWGLFHLLCFLASLGAWVWVWQNF